MSNYLIMNSVLVKQINTELLFMARVEQICDAPSMDAELKRNQYTGQQFTRYASAEIAKALSISTSTLNRMFLAHLGKPAERCLQERKMHTAAQLLRNNRKLPVKEIAQKVGYPDQGQFYRRFRAFFGCSPEQFRNLP
ncbi:MAG: AraC family transcriptional regulator [Clostridia bacterium]|nr:AraC family transcriptional regulator [Clostridia bacterium]